VHRTFNRPALHPNQLHLALALLHLFVVAGKFDIFLRCPDAPRVVAPRVAAVADGRSDGTSLVSRNSPPALAKPNRQAFISLLNRARNLARPRARRDPAARPTPTPNTRPSLLLRRYERPLAPHCPRHPSMQNTMTRTGRPSASTPGTGRSTSIPSITTTWARTHSPIGRAYPLREAWRRAVNRQISSRFSISRRASRTIPSLVSSIRRNRTRVARAVVAEAEGTTDFPTPPRRSIRPGKTSSAQRDSKCPSAPLAHRDWISAHPNPSRRRLHLRLLEVMVGCPHWTREAPLRRSRWARELETVISPTTLERRASFQDLRTFTSRLRRS
jgi:hypothetical protein